MDFEAKVDMIKRCLKLGMDLDSAMILAECSDEDMERINADSTLTRSFDITAKFYEMDLLQKLDTALTMNVRFGNTTEVRWLLERINKARFGNNANIKLTKEPRVVRFVGPDGTTVVDSSIGNVKQKTESKNGADLLDGLDEDHAVDALVNGNLTGVTE